MLQFKWESFAKAIYMKQFGVFLVHLAATKAAKG